MKIITVENLLPHPSRPNAWIEIISDDRIDRGDGRPNDYVSHQGRPGQTVDEYVHEYNSAVEKGEI